MLDAPTCSLALTVRGPNASGWHSCLVAASPAGDTGDGGGCSARGAAPGEEPTRAIPGSPTVPESQGRNCTRTASPDSADDPALAATGPSDAATVEATSLWQSPEPRWVLGSPDVTGVGTVVRFGGLGLGGLLGFGGLLGRCGGLRGVGAAAGSGTRAAICTFREPGSGVDEHPGTAAPTVCDGISGAKAFVALGFDASCTSRH